jgi:hypothetical protein
MYFSNYFLKLGKRAKNYFVIFLKIEKIFEKYNKPLSDGLYLVMNKFGNFEGIEK